MPFHLVKTKSNERMSLDQMLDRGIDLPKACHMFTGYCWEHDNVSVNQLLMQVLPCYSVTGKR